MYNKLRSFSLPKSNLNYKTKNVMDQNSLIEQLSQYTSDLNNIQAHIHEQQHQRPHQPHLVQLKQKISIKINHMQVAIQHVHNKQYTNATLNHMHSYFQNAFTQVVKEAHRLLQMKVGVEGKQRLDGKLSMLREMEDEMSCVWQQKGVKKEKGILVNLSDNLAMFSQKHSHLQLKSMAKEYLHKEFLAIRMIAYKMYENYINHTHSQHKDKLALIKSQQQQLQMQASELSEVNKSLRLEQKRMMRELNQLKTINNMISRRYFVQQESNPTYLQE